MNIAVDLGLGIGIGGSNRRASWSAPGSLLDLDFRGGRYAVRGRARSLASVATFIRASSAWGLDSAGALRSFASGEPVITDRGFLSSTSRGNGIPNNSMVGGSAPSTLPTGWAGLNGTGITRTYAYGTQFGMPYVEIRFQGTASDASGPSVRPTGMTDAALAALNAQVWTNSCWVALVAGNLANVTDIRFNVFQRTSGGANAGTLAGTDIKASLSGTPARFVNGYTLNQATVAFAQPLLQIGYNTSAVIDFTLRIFGWQFELGAGATAPIMTTGSAAVRAAEMLLINDSKLYPITGSIYAEIEEGIGPTGGFGIIATKFVDASNFYSPYRTADGHYEALSLVGGVPQFALTSDNVAARGSIYRIANAFAVNDAAASYTASLAASAKTDASGSVIGSDGVYFFVGSSYGDLAFDGYIRRLVTFPTRKTNAELQAWAQAA